VATHDGVTATAFPISALSAAAALIAASNPSVVGIDEGQFFEDVAARAEGWANEGRHVIIAGLDATFLRTPFPSIVPLIPRAECVTKLTAVCAGCGADAAFTRRTARVVVASAAPAAASARVSVHSEPLIGGAEAYAAMCRRCYHAAAEADAAADAAEAAEATAAAMETAEAGVVAAAPPAVPLPALSAPPRVVAGTAQAQAQPTTPSSPAAAAGAKKARGASAAAAFGKRPFGAAAAGVWPLSEGVSRLELASSPMAGGGGGSGGGGVHSDDARVAGRALLRRMR
jgi:thymidine kinase